MHVWCSLKSTGEWLLQKRKKKNTVQGIDISNVASHRNSSNWILCGRLRAQSHHKEARQDPPGAFDKHALNLNYRLSEHFANQYSFSSCCGCCWWWWSKGRREGGDAAAFSDSLFPGDVRCVSGRLFTWQVTEIVMSGMPRESLIEKFKPPAPLSPRHSLPVTAGNGCGWQIWGRHVDTGFGLCFFFPPLKMHLNLFSLCQQTAPLFMSLSSYQDTKGRVKAD